MGPAEPEIVHPLMGSKSKFWLVSCSKFPRSENISLNFSRKRRRKRSAGVCFLISFYFIGSKEFLREGVNWGEIRMAPLAVPRELGAIEVCSNEQMRT